MYTRAVASGQGWQWVVNGFRLFRRSPFMWIPLTLVLALLWLLSFAIPVIGPLVFNLLSPVFFAGLMLGCRALEQGEELELGHLFAGFRTRASALVTIGGVHLVGSILIVGVFYVVADRASLSAVLSGGGHVSREEGLNIMLGVLMSLALYTPLLMVIWFAPLLVIFDDFNPVAAMRASFIACCKNIMPFVVYSLVLFALLLVAIPLLATPVIAGLLVLIPASSTRTTAVISTILPLIGLLILLPVVFCSIYASYTDIFVREQRAVPGPAIG